MARLTSDQLINFTKAAIEARLAYDAWLEAGRPYGSDAINDPAYRRVREAGERLDAIGGFDAMTVAQQGLYEHEDDVMGAGTHLNHLWNGIGDWAA